MNGETGAQGYAMAGRAGAAGPSGDVGVQGPNGPMGAQGRVGVVGLWTAYREITFDSNEADIEPSGKSTISEIAAYITESVPRAWHRRLDKFGQHRSNQPGPEQPAGQRSS
jgi:hypothetical protein